MPLPRFDFINAKSIEQAAEILKANPKAKAIGGGTDLLHGFKDHIYSEFPDTVVNLRSAADGYIRDESDGVHIGALTTVSELERDAKLKERFNVLAEAARTVASPQIRNASTIGGNICQEPRCWYYRNADNLFVCLRKGGKDCPAFIGRNDIHSIFGGKKVCDTPCESECPNETPIPRYFEMLRKGDTAGAAKLFLSVSPLAAITGRVCPNTCQEKCNREDYDTDVSIRDVERWLGDYILENAKDLIPAPAPDTGKKVAVIGSGPAGLTAAYYLRLSGNKVVIFDKNEVAGGMLVYGIPAYRLPKDLVAKNVKMIADMGVEIRQGVEIGKNVKLDELRGEYDAVLICIGAWTSTDLGCKGDDAKGIVGGIEFLYKAAGREDVNAAGKIVGVVGGGNTAMDACRSAVRLGAAKVYNFYRRSRAEMPADEVEIVEAGEEGVDFRYLAAPIEAVSEGGVLKKVKLQKMELGEPDDSGRRRPVPIEGSVETVDVDILISAVGQGVNPSGFESVSLTKKRWIAADSLTYATDQSGVFAAGDGAQGPETAVKAIADARKAAASINDYLGVKSSGVDQAEEEPLLTFASDCLMHSEKLVISNKPVKDRSLYVEDTETASLGKIQAEITRCFNCGCIAACPSDIAPALVALDAKIVTTERVFSALDFFKVGVQSSTGLNHGELVKEVILPKPGANAKSVYLKFRHRKAIDFPLFSVAIVMSLEGNKIAKASIALGGAAPVPIKASAAEELLAGKELTEELAGQTAKEALKGALVISDNGYKVSAAKAYIKRAILQCAR
ncbi:MAG: FAD binding domain-containing protein [Syntrophorhabdaceae bacterium]|nr:FAD binding domain-containing protein [Syntrophorhabdaceae bacterium]